jgi:hypothetical protein
LPAQNRTISILTHLLKHKGKHIPAKYFGISSYTTSKNEMISKIISPLKKICLNELNLELPLFCEGNLTDFSLYLDDKQLPISILEST